MSDEITCPDCSGKGTTRLGPLLLQCGFCHGAGTVGGDHEPAEDPPPPLWPGNPVWMHPAVAGIPGCEACLGSGTVVTLAEEVGGSLVKTPCPLCGGTG